MSIPNVAFTDTFDTHRTVTNQLVTAMNPIANGTILSLNVVATLATVASNAAAAFTKANATFSNVAVNPNTTTAFSFGNSTGNFLATNSTVANTINFVAGSGVAIRIDQGNNAIQINAVSSGTANSALQNTTGTFAGTLTLTGSLITGTSPGTTALISANGAAGGSNSVVYIERTNSGGQGAGIGLSIKMDEDGAAGKSIIASNSTGVDMFHVDQSGNEFVFGTLGVRGTATLANGSATYMQVVGHASNPFIQAAGATNVPFSIYSAGRADLNFFSGAGIDGLQQFKIKDLAAANDYITVVGGIQGTSTPTISTLAGWLTINPTGGTTKVIGNFITNATAGGEFATFSDSAVSNENRIRINSTQANSGISLLLSNDGNNNQIALRLGSVGQLDIYTGETSGASPTSGTVRVSISDATGVTTGHRGFLTDQAVNSDPGGAAGVLDYSGGFRISSGSGTPAPINFFTRGPGGTQQFGIKDVNGANSYIFVQGGIQGGQASILGTTAGDLDLQPVGDTVASHGIGATGQVQAHSATKIMLEMPGASSGRVRVWGTDQNTLPDFAVNLQTANGAQQIAPLYLSPTGGKINVSISIYSVLENVAQTSPTPAICNVDFLTSSIGFYSANLSANVTLNFRGNSSTRLDACMANGQSWTTAVILTNGSGAANVYYPTTYQVDGSAATIRWAAGTAPGTGHANSSDVYEFSIMKYNANSYLILGSQTQYA